MKQGWEIRPFEKCIEKVKYTTKIATCDYSTMGAYPVVSQEEEYISGYWNNAEDVFRVSKPVVIFGDHTRVLKYVDFDFVLGADGVKILQPIDAINAKFFLYYLIASKIPSLGYSRHYKLLKELNVPVPPIAEQEKIVAELDCLSEIIEKKKQQLKELDNLAQSIFYEMFSNQDGTPVKLSQACSIVSGLVNPNDEPYCNYPHIGGANIESHTGKFVNVKLAKEENLISGKYPFDDTMILYSKIRPNLNKVALPSFKGICSADMYPLIPQNEFDKVFLKYILTQKVFLDYAISHSGRANIPKINREDLLNYEFLTYPITLQQDFASKIESIEKQKELIAQSIKEAETLFNSRMDYYFG